MVEQLDLFELANEMGRDDEDKLTPRQWATYRLIKSNSLKGLKTTQKEIFENVNGYVWNEEVAAHDHCVAIGTDVRAINLSFETEKIICYKNFEYWLGTKEECDAFLDDLWKQLSPRLIRYWFYKKKLSQDGQGKLISKQMKPIDADSQAREFVESYLKRDDSNE